MKALNKIVINKQFKKYIKLRLYVLIIKKTPYTIFPVDSYIIYHTKYSLDFYIEEYTVVYQLKKIFIEKVDLQNGIHFYLIFEFNFNFLSC